MNAAAAGTIAAGDGFSTMRARWRMAFLLHPDLRDREQRVAALMLEMTSRTLWQQQGQVLTWVSVPALTRALRQCDRTIQRARAMLVKLGVLRLARAGGHGRRDSSAFSFDPAWLEHAEERLRDEGAFAALGMIQWPPGSVATDSDDTLNQPWGDTPVANHQPKGDSSVALGHDGAAVALGDALKDDRTVTLNQPWGDRGVASHEPKGDTVTGHAAKGDSSVTLKAPEAARAVTLKPQNEDSSVEKLLIAAPVDGFRVTNRVAKGDKSGPFRVTDLSPEPFEEQDSNPRARTRGRRKPANPPPKPGQGNLMLPIRGGRDRADNALDQAVRASRTRSDAGRDQRAVELCERAAELLGDRGRANLAVSCMDAGLKSAILAGQPVADDRLTEVLRDGLASLEASHTEHAGTGPPAIPITDLVAALRLVLPELLGPLIAAVGALLPEPLKPLVAEALKHLPTAA